jgi:hypothetical protein
MTYDPDAGPRSCRVCGEIETTTHVFCMPANRARPPAAPTWQSMKPSDSPDSQHAAAISDARALLQQLGDEVDQLAKLSPSAPLEEARDHRKRSTALGRLADIVRAMREVKQGTMVSP